MVGLSDVVAQDIADHFTGKTAWAFPTGLDIGLSTTTPTDAGAFTEPSGNGYARVSTVPADWNAATTNGTSTNANSVGTFTASGGNWGTITHVLFFLTPGNIFLGFSDLTPNLVVNDGNTVDFPAGNLTLNMNNNDPLGWSDLVAQRIADHATGKTQWALPTNLFIGLSTTAPTVGDGTGITEPSGNGYARISTAPADWDAASGTGVTQNANLIGTWTASGGNWGTIIHGPIYDALTAGNYLGSGTIPSTTINDGNTAKIDVGDYTLNMNNN